MSSIADSPAVLQHSQFRATVEALAQKAHHALPLANGRIEKAVELVLSGGVTLRLDGHAVMTACRSGQRARLMHSPRAL